jgi:hypothetical protein
MPKSNNLNCSQQQSGKIRLIFQTGTFFSRKSSILPIERSSLASQTLPGCKPLADIRPA